MIVARRFPNRRDAVKGARTFALETLAAYPSGVLEVVELLVSELASNSVRHTNSGFEVRISSDASRIRVSVTDNGGGEPRVQELGPSAISGRGLALVQELSDSWGVSPSRSLNGGKTVWLELHLADPRHRHGLAARRPASEAHPAELRVAGRHGQPNRSARARRSRPNSCGGCHGPARSRSARS
ncbi:MAG TPA: ATP-binding protein [Solirubrobacteraceae bacterium]|nr:ATP-binding protein [Solirubrobacteraceae bacterium]